MVATVYIEEANGAAPTPAHTRVDAQVLNDGTDVRFCTTDAVAPVATYPCIIPSSGFNYSYWKHLFLAIKDTAYTTINNVRFYTDGGIGWNTGTNGGLFVALRDAGDHGCPMDTSYEISAGVQGTTGYEIHDATNGHDYYKGQTATPVLASGYTAGSPLTVDTADYSAAVDDCDAVVLQVKLFTDATQGTQTDETLTFIYDEI